MKYYIKSRNKTDEYGQEYNWAYRTYYGASKRTKKDALTFNNLADATDAVDSLRIADPTGEFMVVQEKRTGRSVKTVKVPVPETKALSNKERGIYGKYTIFRTDGRPIPDDEFMFVLKGTDPHALAALKAYADSCRADYPLLGFDLDMVVAGLERGEAPGHV